MTSKISTWNKFKCPIFGSPKDLSQINLPTYEDMLRCCFFERLNLAPKTGNKEPSFSTIAENVASKIESVWAKASTAIPIVTHTRILQMIHTYHAKYTFFKKSYKRDYTSKAFQTKIKTFREEACKKLFDIAVCKCISFEDCTCERSKKLPQKEHNFLKDQRTTRILYIGSLDINETKRLQNIAYNAARKAQNLYLKDTKAMHNTGNVENKETDTSSDTSEVYLNQDFYQPSTSNHQISFTDPKIKQLTPIVSKSSQMRLDLPSTAVVADRYGVSDRAAAAIASSVLKDVGLITSKNSDLVIDKNKLRREKSKVRNDIKFQALSKAQASPLKGLYFDGRKDLTLIEEIVDTKRYTRKVKEEHLSLIEEPGSHYITHLSPSFGTGKQISLTIIEYFEGIARDLSQLLAIGCDGAYVNTGWKSGVIRCMELKLGKPMQWIICLLHFNELTLRHLFEMLDGPTNGPKSYSGNIGKALLSCETLPVTTYEIIHGELPTTDRRDLSQDQKYLLEISEAVRLGKCSDELARRNPGTLSHSRWLTTANRVLRLYISSPVPSLRLKQIAEFVMKVYTPNWFDIKSNYSVKDGAKHVWSTISRSRYLPQDLKNVVDGVISRNSFFAHPENLLLCMLMDERSHIRELAAQHIIKSRESSSNIKSVRVFLPPKLNFEAADYTEMIDWASVNITSPPILRDIPTAIFSSMQHDKKNLEWDFVHFPCHTQAVERCVKLVTEASAKVYGFHNRDGFIRATFFSRSIMPEFDHKADFQPLPAD